MNFLFGFTCFDKLFPMTTKPFELKMELRDRQRDRLTERQT